MGSLVERFQQALEAVSGHCIVVRNENEAAEAIQQIIEQTKARQIAVSNSPLVQKVIGECAVRRRVLENAAASSPLRLRCQASPAPNGPLPRLARSCWSRTRSAIVCLRSCHQSTSRIIEASRIRQTLGEVLQALSEKGPDGLSPTVTFITGPSRTSDIELTLAIGVHGPGELYVIVLEGDDV